MAYTIWSRALVCFQEESLPDRAVSAINRNGLWLAAGRKDCIRRAGGPVTLGSLGYDVMTQ